MEHSAMSAALIEQLILVTHLLLALAIIGLIMLQQGKGADMGASFGAGASQTLFGSSGSGNVLTRTTAWMVALFFATSFGLAVIANNKTASATDFDLPLPEQGQLVEDSELPTLDAGEVGPAARGDVPGLDDMPGADELSPQSGRSAPGSGTESGMGDGTESAGDIPLDADLPLEPEVDSQGDQP
jgi:preprotein translocase subunit SecG